MLIKCPECNAQISDKAYACPHCGYPMNIIAKPAIRRSSKRRRLPNGFGQITELKNRNLAKPFRAMVTMGFTETGRPIQKLLKPSAYFATYNEAYEALLKYNKNPYSFDSFMTVKELYEKWYPYYEKKVNSKTIQYVGMSWERLKPIWNIKLCNLRKADIKQAMKDSDGTPVNISNMKRIIKSMLDYAVEYEILDKNVASDIDLSDVLIDKTEKYKTVHKNFTDDELRVLWSHSDDLFAKYILIQSYMGWRPSELITIKKSNINLQEEYIIGGIKTKSGIDRKVPIHSCIKNIIKELYYYNNGTEYLIYEPHKGVNRSITYLRFIELFEKYLGKIGISESHKAHDSRVTFVTLAKKYHVDEYAIKYIVGHKIKDFTENTYTRREISWLKSEIEKIKVYE